MTRHARPNRCPRCNAATFSVCVGFTKPEFRCDNGCNVWSSGTDGEPYLKHARNYCVGGAESWVAFVWNGKELVATGLPLPDASSDRSYDAAPASPSAGGGAGWQPIETAPKDGTWFVICLPGERFEVGQYDPTKWTEYVPSEIDGLFRQQERVIYEWGGFNNFHNATHWMPLPAPPATKGPTDDR